MSKSWPVPYAFLEECAAKYAGMSLDARRPTAKIIEWRRRSWISVGALSQGFRYHWAELRECVPQEKYHGRPNDPKRDGHHYYTGKIFVSAGKAWAMTANEIRLVPDDQAR